MHRIIYLSCFLLVLLGAMVSCSDSDSSEVTYDTTFGNADQLPGSWEVTQKYLLIIDSEGDKLKDSIADIIKPMNAIFSNWINNGKITFDCGTLAPFKGTQAGSLEEAMYLKNNETGLDVPQQILSGNYYVQSNNEDVTIEYTEPGSVGKVEWRFTTKVGVHESTFYMKQKLYKADLELLWKIYGNGNREFFSTDTLTMITRAKRVVK